MRRLSAIMGKEAKKTKPARTRPSESPPPPKDRPGWWRFVRYCLVLLLAGAAALAWLSVLSFCPTDPSPSNTVWPPQPVRNAGGVAGAYLAYAMLYWLGDASPNFANTWAFLDRRIEDIMRFEKTKAQLNENPLVRAAMWGPMQVLNMFRAPGAPPDTPGETPEPDHGSG